MKEIEIQGCVSLPESVSADDFTVKFIDWIEANGWSFGGGFNELDENGKPKEGTIKKKK